MKKFTANIVKNNECTSERIQCIATDETHLFSKVWMNLETGKKYIITKMYNKSWFHEIDA